MRFFPRHAGPAVPHGRRTGAPGRRTKSGPSREAPAPPAGQNTGSRETTGDTGGSYAVPVRRVSSIVSLFSAKPGVRCAWKLPRPDGPRKGAPILGAPCRAIFEFRGLPGRCSRRFPLSQGRFGQLHAPHPNCCFSSAVSLFYTPHTRQPASGCHRTGVPSRAPFPRARCPVCIPRRQSCIVRGA